MMFSLKFFREPKTRIGWVHGILTILGAFALAYLSGMVLTSLLRGDYAERILPMMILAPMFVSMYGIWLLFSKTLLQVVQKIATMSVLALIVLLCV